MEAHVICCNDRVDYVVMEDLEKAKLIMVDLIKADYLRTRWSYKDEAEYKQRCYWHIHTVEGE